MTGKTDTAPVRLNRFLAQVGVASRRACDDLIAAGKVRVNGRIVREAGVSVRPDVDEVEFSGQRLSRPSRRVILLLNKPIGVVSTASDPAGRQTVVDLCRHFARGTRLFPVGRLDINTTGALLLTNDGLLCYRLTHPSFGIERTYLVRVRGPFSDETLGRLDRMSRSGDATVAPPAAARVRSRRTRKTRREYLSGHDGNVALVKRVGKVTVIRVRLREGRNRQVRKMCNAVGLHVIKLKRISFASVTTRKLPVGAARPLEPREIEKLERAMAKPPAQT